MSVVAWAYMVELDNALSKEQVNKLMSLIPDDEQVIPFSNDVTNKENHNLLESNSIAYGFLKNEHYDDLIEVQKALAAVCNDFEIESEDNIYTTKNGLKVLMLCDNVTI